MKRVAPERRPVMSSRAMRELDRVLRAVAPKDVVVSLVGESGTGKELLARRIHDLSPRRAGPFIPINCAAIPDALFESELFGHERGAFTGATTRARGKLDAADGGTLFLDEIGEMPLAVQAKLLRFLENHKFMRVGGSAKISVDARVVSATLRPLEDEVSAGRFRADLLYRIQGIPLRVPPLRERAADVGPLLAQLTREICDKHETKPPRYTRAANAALRAYAWPGNVRELRNVVELVCLLREGKPARLRDLPEAVQRAARPSITTRETLEIRLDRSLHETVDDVVRAALALEGGNRSRAAQRLGISLRTMQRFVARLGAPSRMPIRH
ncbi:MAG: sigma-54-dependent Fis family transcriptional regulator [Labilithrix sp.]|nr:sigma-54-dependent Fis family transcriptional regulator [Labilithrix sp.]